MEACANLMEVQTAKEPVSAEPRYGHGQRVSGEASALRSSRSAEGDPVGSSRGFGAEIGVEGRTKPRDAMRSSG